MITIKLNRFLVTRNNTMVVAVPMLERVGPGITVIRGENGSGKSSLVLGLGGLCRTRGSVLVCGHELGTTPPHKRSRAGLAIMLQEKFVFPPLTVRDHAHIAWNRDIFWDFLNQSQTSLAKIPNARVGNLSGGQRKSIGLALTLSRDPKVIVLDEPTSGLDVDARELFAERIAALSDRIRVVVIEHSSAAHLRRVNDALTVEDGKVSGPHQ